jgi:hypothetical protein
MQWQMPEQQLNLDPQTLGEEQNVSIHCHTLHCNGGMRKLCAHAQKFRRCHVTVVFAR